jgi:hypothetical protein
MSRRIAALAVTALAVLPVAGAGGATTQRFQTPSKRIACAYPGPELRCDMLFLNDRAAVLGRHGRARIVKVTDTVADPKAKVLRYGSSLRIGPYRCTSRRTGLTCRNRRSGHGFTISRERRKVW